MGNAYRDALKFNEYGESLFVNAVLFQNGYQYGISDKTWEKLNNFDYIQGKTQHAIDLNGNGTVDNNEIFEGEIDRLAYKKAKDFGDLNKYQKYRNEYEY